MRDALHYLQEYYTLQRLGDITWAHAVNSQDLLHHALTDPQVMMIESDIRVSPTGEIIATHPPLEESDLRFDDLLEAVQTSKKGLKLDFKDVDAIRPCLERLQVRQMQRPVLLNANVLQGMGGWPPKLQASEFLAWCKDLYPQGILSIDWTMGYYSTNYSRENVEEMLKLCCDHHLQQVTFPVRATYLPASWAHVARLLQVEGYSLTVWDVLPLAKDVVRWLRDETDPTRVCYDCQDEDGAPFRFD
ncbi:MAG: FAM151A/B family protein [Ktedonobacteraceae bacterium]